MKRITRRAEGAALLVIVLAAAFLRLYRLDQVPPGWRDDELINSLVISQHVLDGEWAFFYPDASGHEALYHVLNAGMLALFGPGVAGIRWLSALLGVGSVWLTYLLGRDLFGRTVATLASLGLAFGFWSLMYSRVGLRHVSLLPLMLGAFVLLWRAIGATSDTLSTDPARPPRPARDAAIGGALLGVGLYTYFAARGLPLIVLALVGYWLFFDRPRLRRNWRKVGLFFVVAAALAVPLILSLALQPEMTGRVEELAVPLLQAARGNWEPLLQQTVTTLSMFHADGDSEWLYNIPRRPVFNSLGAVCLLLGLLVSLYRALPSTTGGHKGESAFLLLWFVAGLAPAFVSVPAASLGHTIVAQPATYLLPAVGLASVGEWAAQRRETLGRVAVAGLGVIFLGTNAVRDLDDYFRAWPERGMVRFLYRADIRDAALYLGEHQEMEDVALGSSLAGPWDQQALRIDLERPVADRWFDPSRAVLYPARGGHLVLTGFPEIALQLESVFAVMARLPDDHGNLQVFETLEPALSDNSLPGGREVVFDNGLTLVGLMPAPGGVLTEWRADKPPFGLAPRRLISNPPPPGEEVRPRLAVFAHLLDAAGSLIAADDGLWVDPHSLRPGDMFLQLHRFPEGLGSHDLEVGLYDPVTGQRVAREDGSDRLVLRLSDG